MPADQAGAPSAHLCIDDLALLAVGEPATTAAAEHLEQCHACATEASALATVVGLATEDQGRIDLTPPPDRVWRAIERQLQDESTATVVALRPRRAWSTRWLASAAAVGLLAGSVATAVTVADQPAPAEPATTVVAATALAALPEHSGSGQAELVTVDGQRLLVVDVADLTTGDGFYEVWLIDPETLAMVGLGALPGGGGRFVVPDGLDLSRYRLVDVSLEPLDGDPRHSRDSVVRGELSA
jgi:hypothetical protein